MHALYTSKVDLLIASTKKRYVIEQMKSWNELSCDSYYSFIKFAHSFDLII